MTAKIITITDQEDTKVAIDEAVQTLSEGGLVVYPTDTSYGLACDPRIPDAFENLFDVKQRERSSGLPLLFANSKQCREYHDFSGLELAIARLFWPGALTLIVSAKEGVPEHLISIKNSIAIRVPDHPIPRTIADLLGTPISGTSANLSGGASPFDLSVALEQLGDRVDLYIDGGPSRTNKNSTIIGVDDDSDGFSSIKVYREGALPIETLTEGLKFDTEALRFWTNRIIYADM